ncbi:MAG TPA: hypothetical protein VFR44_10615 [Actinomycetota bacterium]|nr:hypothetical protein [Actinomycetota bacterium]
MCRARKVLCVADGEEALAALKRATVSAEWELAPGATTQEEALAQLDRERPHMVVAFGDQGAFVAAARKAYPALRIVTDRDLPGATWVATSLDEVRGALRALPRPGGPVL